MADSDRWQQALHLIDALRSPDPCQYDHNGSCQEHGYYGIDAGRCPHQLAVVFLAENDDRLTP